MSKTKIVFVLFLMSIFCATLCAESAFELDLNQAIIIALKNNLDLKISQEDINIAKAKTSEAKSGLWPQINSSATYTRTNELFPKGIDTVSTNVGIEYNVFDWGKIKNIIKSNQANEAIQKYSLDTRVQEIIYQVKYIFYTLILQDEFVKLNQEYLELAKLIYNTSKERLSKGLVSKEEMLKIEKDILFHAQELEDSLNQEEILKITFKKLLNLKLDTQVNLTGEFEYKKDDVILDELMLITLKNRPEIKALDEKIESDKANLNIAKSNNKPSVSMGLDYNFSNRTTAAIKNYNDYWQGFAKISIPIFDGFLTKAKINQAISEASQTKILKEKTNAEIQAELKENYLTLKNTNTKIATYQKDLEVAETNYLTVKERFKKGLESLIDEKSNNLVLSLARFNYTQAIYDNFVAKAKLEKSIGKAI